MIVVKTIMVGGKIKVSSFLTLPQEKIPVIDTTIPHDTYSFCDNEIPEDFYRNYQNYIVLPTNPPLLQLDPHIL